MCVWQARAERGAVPPRHARSVFPAATRPLPTPLLCPCHHCEVGEGSLGDATRGVRGPWRRLGVWLAPPCRCAHCCPSCCRVVLYACDSDRIAPPFHSPCLAHPYDDPSPRHSCTGRTYACRRSSCRRRCRLAPTNIPPCHRQCITQAHAPCPPCHAFDLSTVGVHAYKVAMPVFHASAHA